MTRIKKNNLTWFLAVSLTILAFSSIPYWVAYSAETDDLLFRGIYFDAADYSVHTSMMQAGRMGSWVYEMRFTSEAHQPAFLRMFYIVLGHISKWVNLSVEKTYHVARWVFGFIAIYSIHQLCNKVFPNPNHARTALLLCVLGAGAGWLQLLLGAPLQPISPIDFWLIDAYVFFSISLFPSFSFTLALMTTALNYYLDYLKTGKWQIVAFISLLAIACQITNPIAFAVIDVAFAGGTFILWWKNRKIELKHFYALGTIALAQIPLLTYNFLILQWDPIWSQFTHQNQTLSPPPIFYLWGFAPFWVFAVYGIIIALRERNAGMGVMATWVISGFILAYLPVPIQRRFILGITIPLGILAMYGLSHLVIYLSTRLRGLKQREYLVYFTYILMASVSSIYLILCSSMHMQSRPSDKFYPREIANALLWLDKNSKPNEFVLSSSQTGELIAQYTDLKVYIGHKMETLNFIRKTDEISSFYNGNTDLVWRDGTSIDWVFFGPYEKSLIAEKDFSFGKGTIMYQSENVKIYKLDQ